MTREQFFGDAGIHRNPRVGERVRFRQSPDVIGIVNAEKRDTSGGMIFHVLWSSGPVRESWHPAEGLSPMVEPS